MQLFHVNEGNSGTMEVNVTAQTYKFQMSTLSYVGGELVEGDLSLVGPESIVFVPMPGTYCAFNDCAHFTYMYQGFSWNKIKGGGGGRSTVTAIGASSSASLYPSLTGSLGVWSLD